MPVLTRPQLQAAAELIRDETVTSANTAERVGGTLLDMIDSLALLTEIGGGGGGDITSVVAGTLLSGGGTNGDVTLNLADLAGLTVIGRAANSTGAPAAIAAASDGQVLRRSGTALGFGPIDLASAQAVSGDLSFANMAQLAGLSVLGRSLNTTGDMAAITAATDGHVLRRLGTALGFALLLNANIDPAAAIAGTKISPNFGAQDIASTGSLSLGSSPAATGILRIPFNQTLKSRSGFASVDIDLLALVNVSSADAIAIGGTGSGTHVPVRTTLNASGSHALQISGTTRFSVGNANTVLNTPTLAFDETIASPTLKQFDTLAATGQTLLVQAQNAATTGGKLHLFSGTGATTPGFVFLARGGSITESIEIGDTGIQYETTTSRKHIFRTGPSAGTDELTIGIREFTIGIRGASSGTPAGIKATLGSNTSLANVEATDWNFGTGHTVGFAGGGSAFTQRAVVIPAPVYSSASAQTLNVAATVSIANAPTINSSLTATRLAALWLEAGGLAFGSNFSTSTTARIKVPHSTDPIISGQTNGGATAHVLRWGGGVDTISLGDNAASTVAAIAIDTITAGQILLRPGGNNRFVVADTIATFTLATIEVAAAISNPIIRHTNVNATTTALTIRAQGRITSSGDGAPLHLEGGRDTTGLMGAVRLRLNPDDTTPETMVEVCELTGGHRVVALCRGSNLSTSQVPDPGGGDRVVYVGNAVTDPTANPAGGFLLWSTGAVPAWMTANGDDVVWNSTSAATATAGAGQATPANIAEYLTITFNGNTRKIPLYLN